MAKFTIFLTEIGNLPHAFWGVLITFSSMFIAVHYNMAIGYYFAGVGSTLLGIKGISNASNSTDQN
jgi:uncharacterized membrane protein